jgi:uncharacterized protein (DUF305 family)
MKIIVGLAVPAVLFGALVIQAQENCRMHANTKSAAEPGWSELNSSMDKMRVSMAAMQSSGDSDVDFVELMLPHHQAAIDMAKVELKFGNDPQMRRMAQEIINDQQSEVALMQLWLKQHHSSMTEPKPAPSSMR